MIRNGIKRFKVQKESLGHRIDKRWKRQKSIDKSQKTILRINSRRLIVPEVQVLIGLI